MLRRHKVGTLFMWSPTLAFLGVVSIHSLVRGDYPFAWRQRSVLTLRRHKVGTRFMGSPTLPWVTNVAQRLWGPNSGLCLFWLGVRLNPRSWMRRGILQLEFHVFPPRGLDP